MNWYRRFIISGKIQDGDDNFSWVRLDVPSEIKRVHTSVVDEINDRDLYKEEQGSGDWSHGIEDKPHITIEYGIEFDDPAKVIEILKGEKSGKVSVDDVEIFDNKDYDVLVVRCKSEVLQKLHKKLTKELDIEEKYPVYKPHITIAYFKKGKAKKYEAMASKAFTYYQLDFDCSEVVFQDRDDKETTIKLG